MKSFFPRVTMLAALLVLAPMVQAAEYKIDPGHSFVEFRVKHLGYSWLYGRFNKMSGSFSHDAAKPAANQIALEIDMSSVDSNHAERDKHLRSDDFLDVQKNTSATFNSTAYSGNAEQGTLTGDLTLHGVTKSISIKVTKLGEGKDPWGGYRAGFAGTIILDRRDFGIAKNLGSASWTVEMDLGIEGTRN
ncbi:MAG: polyisoprenoid-binding protein YceI [Gammaproteobacteria bacterium]|jgi:polyisoprenoid-binding protein YceI